MKTDDTKVAQFYIKKIQIIGNNAEIWNKSHSRNVKVNFHYFFIFFLLNALQLRFQMRRFGFVIAR